ncbi:penicillin-binding protein [Oxalobacteraceae bacterium OM1]|nr:penicillin-binding protein [Oxalobacteraceae bacterium OM1]
MQPRTFRLQRFALQNHQVYNRSNLSIQPSTKVSTVDHDVPQQPEPEPVPAARARRRHRSLGTHLVNLLGIIAVLLVAAAILAGAYVARIAPTTPGIDDLLDARNAQPSTLYSAQGTLLATYTRGQQERVGLDKISPYVIKALIATEDRRFYDHRGVDIQRTLSAAWHTVRGDQQGGSTITQQLVRNIFPEDIGRARTIDRKLREMITALKIENAYSKDQILETYLNTVPFLYNVVGIEMAARTYYDKSAAQLDPEESATLVGMLKGTSYYNPVINPDRAKKRRNVVLAQMVKTGDLKQDEFKRLKALPMHVKLNRPPEPLGSAPHFAAYARKQLLEWTEQNGYNLYTDGLVIESTIDDRLQAAAQQAVDRESEVLQQIADVEWGQSSERVASQTPGAYAKLHKKVEPFKHFWAVRSDLLDTFIRETPDYRKAVAKGTSDASALTKLKMNARFMQQLRESKTRLETGFLAMEPNTGAVKAWVGSRDFEVDQFDHVAQAERQPGSTFKPFVYGAALEIGLAPDRLYQDGPVEIRADDGSIWRPTDMSGTSNQPMSMRDGLVYSKNTITAQVMQDAGLQNIVNLARAVGVKQSRLDAVPSLALGTSPVTLLEMVTSYSTIARIGEYRKPLAVARIKDRHGNVLAEFQSDSQRVMSEDTAVELIDMMRGVVRRGTGTMVKTQFNLTADIAGKTGTTQYNTDGWFILMHPKLVAGAWVGFNDSRVTMRSDYWGQGGHNAALLVGDFFKDVLKAKLVDTKAKFPPSKHPAPVMVKAPEPPPIDPQNLPPGYGLVTSKDGSTTLVVGPNGVEGVRKRDEPQSEDGLSRFLSSFGRRKGGAETSTGASSSLGVGASGVPEAIYNVGH